MSTRTELQVAEVMISFSDTPKVSQETLFKDSLEIMDKNRLGIVCIIGKHQKLEGIMTDGDIRRILTRIQKPIAALMSDDVINHAIKNPTTVTNKTLLNDAIILMGQKQIWDLPVVADDGTLTGLLHLHPAIKAMIGMKEND